MRLGLFIALLLGALTPLAITLPVATPLERLPVDPDASPPPRPQCFRLYYTGALHGYKRDSPTQLRLLPTVLDSNRLGRAIYRAEDPSRFWRQPLWWTFAGSDSMDVVYHHVPVLRLPVRGDTLTGRVSGQIGYTFFHLLIAPPEPKVRAIRVACAEPEQVTAAVPALSEATNSSSCTPLPDSLEAKPLGMRAGTYSLTLVANSGNRAGRRTSGRLQLWPTSRSDRSPRTGQYARAPLTETPFYGFTDLDFEKVGAPVFPSDTLAPPPTSRDPVYPGVLVTAMEKILDMPAGYVLLVGTLFNRRADTGWLDGAGIGLWVRKIDDHGFAGSWREWGIVADGQGYFCAVRTG